jgi:hypothetical protein
MEAEEFSASRTAADFAAKYGLLTSSQINRVRFLLDGTSGWCMGH